MKRINNDNTITELKGGDKVFTWSDWLSPDCIERKNVPERAGIYMLRAIDNQGEPAFMVDREGSDLHGVIYIGMTGSSNSLKNRFMSLVRAWRTVTKWKNAPHGSRAHFESDPVAKALLKGHSFQVRYLNLPTAPKTEDKSVTDYAKSMDITAEEFRSAIGICMDHDERVFAVEAGHIQRFKREFRESLPLLNRDDDGKNDVLPTDEWMDEHLKQLEEIDAQ
ncbi:MAG: hypothetical protein KF824_11620 [Fimbriimonadaceae bacterium]|nr:MAG: hypothetical protein KF824_11620 [Fimbriimonadaceae bacterium]